ncbi:hypothetical protein SH668x_000131 [Planctomicrobium sp. SH668]|uniref:hypothetical protein n=1 Tax=Planctomicrobium sp. SH668 TaxID=3448126 RepID=UPI003F5B5586
MLGHSIEIFPAGHTEFDFLKPSVEAMFSIIDEFIDQECCSDRIRIPYWSNERAMLSQFIGGIWRADPGNYALEEYSCTKGEVERKYRGRRDAWFRIEGQSCCAEVKLPKYCWPAANRFTVAKATANIESAYQEAQRAMCDAVHPDWLQTFEIYKMHGLSTGVATNNVQNSIRCLGMIFAVPRIHHKQQKRGNTIFESYAQRWRAAAASFADERHCRILWGRYFRQSLLEDGGFFHSPYYGHWISTPQLDFIICECSQS